MGRRRARRGHRDRLARAQANGSDLRRGGGERRSAHRIIESRQSPGCLLAAILRRRDRQQDRVREHARHGGRAARWLVYGEPRRDRRRPAVDGGAKSGHCRGSRCRGPGGGTLREGWYGSHRLHRLRWKHRPAKTDQDPGRALSVSGLTGRIALFTGGGRGIGRAVALSLASAGADVAVTARSSNELEETAAAIRALGRRAEAIICDVAERPQVDTMIARVKSALGDPLILVNNAGIAGGAKLADTTDEMWDRMLRVNATGAFYCTRAVLPMMLQAKWGRIVNIASVAAKAGGLYIAAYTASKHALLGLTRAVASEVAARGITVNAVCPGYVDTEMTDGSVANISKRTGRTEEDARKILEGFSPQGRLMPAAEVAAMATYLCSEVARGINGQSIVIDGGAVQG